MRMTVTVDDELLTHARELTGTMDPSALITESLELVVRIESGRRLAALGGTDPGATTAVRSRGYRR